MTTYTVTKAQQELSHIRLSDVFDISPADITFEETTIETVPWHTGESQSRPGSKNGMYGKKRPDLAAQNTSRIGKEFHTEESKQKIRESMTGEGNPMYGNTHSEEVKVILKTKALARERKECPHCRKMMPPGNLAQHLVS